MLSGAQRSRSISTPSLWLQVQQSRKHYQTTIAVAMTYTKRRFAAELLAELERDLAEAEPAISVVRLALGLQLNISNIKAIWKQA